MSLIQGATVAGRHAHNWKALAVWHSDGYYTLKTDDTGEVPVRLFLTPALLAELEDMLYQQIVNATRFPGVQLVVITPDAHFGYGVPVGSVILTDGGRGAVAMGPVGFDIGCGMMSARSTVPAAAATYEQRLAFNRAVMQRVDMGIGGKRKQHRLGTLSKEEFTRLVHGGAEYYVQHYGATFDRSRAERHRIPVDDAWQIPWGGKGRPERGIACRKFRLDWSGLVRYHFDIPRRTRRPCTREVRDGRGTKESHLQNLPTRRRVGDGDLCGVPYGASIFSSPAFFFPRAA